MNNFTYDQHKERNEKIQYCQLLQKQINLELRVESFKMILWIYDKCNSAKIKFKKGDSLLKMIFRTKSELFNAELVNIIADYYIKLKLDSKSISD